MLKVTDRAASILKVAKSIEGSPEAGVRIKRGPTSNNKSIGVVFQFPMDRKRATLNWSATGSGFLLKMLWSDHSKTERLMCAMLKKGHSWCSTSDCLEREGTPARPGAPSTNQTSQGCHL